MSKKNLKKALIPSVIALVLCFAMLLGTTFAWFTDTAEVASNTIASGTLDIELQIGTLNENGGIDYASVTGDTKVLPANALWEPGYAACINAKVVNKGNLALKYTLVIDGAAAPTDEGAFDLASVIDVYYAADEVVVTGRDFSGLTRLGTLRQVIAGGNQYAVNDALETKDAEDKATIVLVMQETAGNDYQGLSLGEDGFTIKVVATQYTYEEDAFDDQYDADASFPG